MSYSCCTTDCEFCGCPVCQCDCLAAQKQAEEIEAKARFTAACDLIARHLSGVHRHLLDQGSNKMIGLQFNAFGDRVHGHLRIGYAEADSFGSSEGLWRLIQKAKTPSS